MTAHKDTLWQVIPAIYREKDNGDLQRYLSACASLLDQIHRTLDQRMADNFPDNPVDDGQPCQEWLLPYFADLLDVRLVSPSAEGRRDEVANAVRWRQGKGTLQVAEQVAQSIGQLEVVVQEGWKRLAMTPRLNIPLVPASHYGWSQAVPSSPPSIAARHPALSAVTPDLRCPSGAIASSSANPASQSSEIDGDARVWRQVSQHGAPCHPGAYDDVSSRTADVRCADWQYGHYHPRRVLLYHVPDAGFFPNDMPAVNWSANPTATFLKYIEVRKKGKLTVFRNRTLGTDHFVPVKVRKVIKLGQVPSGVGPANFHTWRFEGLVLDNTVEADRGRVELDTCAARFVKAHAIDEDKPVITATNCLLKRVQAARGLVWLEYCTVLESCLSEVIKASDCLFTGLIRKDHPTPQPPDNGCLRFSRVIPGQPPGGMHFSEVTSANPYFIESVFGERSCGVLHPASEVAVRQGAEDGTELGAYHHRYLALAAEAVADKLRDYLPVGMEPAIIPDVTMNQIPQQ